MCIFNAVDLKDYYSDFNETCYILLYIILVKNLSSFFHNLILCILCKYLKNYFLVKRKKKEKNIFLFPKTIF